LKGCLQDVYCKTFSRDYVDPDGKDEKTQLQRSAKGFHHYPMGFRAVLFTGIVTLADKRYALWVNIRNQGAAITSLAENWNKRFRLTSPPIAGRNLAGAYVVLANSGNELDLPEQGNAFIINSNSL
jgi:hypothetical protein